MSIMQYLMQQTDEFRDSYQDITKSVSEILDKLETIEFRLKEIELRTNNNRNSDEHQYNVYILKVKKISFYYEKIEVFLVYYSRAQH